MKPIKLPELMKLIEIRYIQKAMKETNCCVAEAAKLLGLGRTTLVMKLKSLHINYGQEREKIKVVTRMKINSHIEVKDQDVQFVNTNFLDEKSKQAYWNFRSLTKEQRINIVDPFLEKRDNVTYALLEKKFMRLIKDDMFKDALIKKLSVV